MTHGSKPTPRRVTGTEPRGCGARAGGWCPPPRNYAGGGTVASGRGSERVTRQTCRPGGHRHDARGAGLANVSFRAWARADPAGPVGFSSSPTLGPFGEQRFWGQATSQTWPGSGMCVGPGRNCSVQLCGFRSPQWPQGLPSPGAQKCGDSGSTGLGPRGCLTFVTVSWEHLPCDLLPN